MRLNKAKITCRKNWYYKEQLYKTSKSSSAPSDISIHLIKLNPQFAFYIKTIFRLEMESIKIDYV